MYINESIINPCLQSECRNDINLKVVCNSKDDSMIMVMCLMLNLFLFLDFYFLHLYFLSFFLLDKGKQHFITECYNFKIYHVRVEIFNVLFKLINRNNFYFVVFGVEMSLRTDMLIVGITNAFKGESLSTKGL